MRIILSSFMVLVGLLVLSGCPGPPQNKNSGSNTSTPPAQTAPPVTSTEPPTPLDPPIEEVRFFGNGHVLLCHKGLECEPLSDGAFKPGDLLRILEDSYVQVDCPDRLCRLPPGEYDACCGSSCSVVAQMKRTGAGNNPPMIKRSDLPPDELRVLMTAETNIRNLPLGPVTKQFLITRLYSGWKLEETKVELETLTRDLEKPEAKTELKQNYQLIQSGTADILKNYNGNEKAKELYKSSLNESTDAVEKANTHVRLADAYERTGDEQEATKNLEKAKAIYEKQGETNAVQKTDEKIKSIRLRSATERAAPLSAPAKKLPQ